MSFRVWVTYSFVFFLCLTLFAQQGTPRAAAELNQGIAQYEFDHYKDAASHLKKAVQLDPDSTQARLYLAKTLTQQFDPKVTTPKNLAFATDAMDQFKELLQRHPQDPGGIKGMAELLERTNKPEEARRYYLQAIALDSKDEEAYTALGKLDYWTAEHRLNAATDFSRSASPIDHPQCASLRAENLAVLDGSIDELKKAFALNAADQNAATFLSLAYHAKANLECGAPKAREADAKQSSTWMDQAMQADQKNMEQRARLVSL